MAIEKKRGVYYVYRNYKDKDGKRRREYLQNGQFKYFPKKSDATQAERNWLSASKPKNQAKILFSDAYSEYLEWANQQIVLKTYRPATIDLNTRLLKKYVLPVIGNTPVALVDFDAIDTIKVKAMQNNKPRSINLILTATRAVLSYALRKGYIDHLPDIQRMPEESTRSQPERLYDSEIQAILSNSNENMKLWIQIALYTGMRPWEIYHLQWEDIDFRNGLLTVRSENRLKKGRVLPIHSELLHILQPLAKKTGNVTIYGSKDSIKGGLNRLAGRLHRLGLMDKSRKIYPKIFRSTFGSRCAEMHMSQMELKALMGHTSINVTTKYYINLDKRLIQDSLNRVSFGMRAA